MKKKIFCYLFLILTTINLGTVHAGQDNPNDMFEVPTPPTTQPQFEIDPDCMAPLTYQATLDAEYQTNVFGASTPRTIQPPTTQPPTTQPPTIHPHLEKGGKKSHTYRSYIIMPTHPMVWDQTCQTTVNQNRVLSKPKRSPYDPPNVSLLATYRLDSLSRDVFEQTQKGLKTKIQYTHNAYSSIITFIKKWDTFQKYFEKLVSITSEAKYFSPAAHELTQGANETIREFMTPSEYLKTVERIVLSGDVFDSQVVSEILSKKLSELGFENYIIQFTPTYTEDNGRIEYHEGSQWVVLYRGYENNWFIADFSLAIKYKYEESKSIVDVISIPFFEYMEPLVKMANTTLIDAVSGLGLYNNVTINFMPGFYEHSDDYYMADIAYLPFNFFVSCKRAVEQFYGSDQHVTKIRDWFYRLTLNPNYRKTTPEPEAVREMREYMILYLIPKE